MLHCQPDSVPVLWQKDLFVDSMYLLLPGTVLSCGVVDHNLCGTHVGTSVLLVDMSQADCHITICVVCMQIRSALHWVVLAHAHPTM